MRIAIISDTHFGDPSSVINSDCYFSKLKKALAPQVDYLILVGDILDFSIASYDQAYAQASQFFKRLLAETSVREIIYLAGNHDGDIWQIVQHERHVINKLRKNKPPESFEHSVAGILDVRKNSRSFGLTLNGVTPNTDSNASKYGGMFLDNITQKNGEAPLQDRIHFSFAYPNLYIVTETETVLVTHGHYLMTYFTFLGEVVGRMAPEVVGEPDTYSIERMSELNFPLSQLACTGVGQAGILTTGLIRPIKNEASQPNCPQIRKYMKRVKDMLIDWIGGGCCFHFLLRILGKGVEKKVVDSIEALKFDRYVLDLANDESVRKRAAQYLNSCAREINDLNKSPVFAGFPIAFPSRMIFGHTHQPIAWNASNAPSVDAGPNSAVKLHNTGGWLNDSHLGFCGAEIFVYDDAKPGQTGFTSVPVR